MHSASCGGPRAVMQSAMKHLRRETMPGIPVCHEKVWITRYIMYIVLPGLLTWVVLSIGFVL